MMQCGRKVFKVQGARPEAKYQADQTRDVDVMHYFTKVMYIQREATVEVSISSVYLAHCTFVQSTLFIVSFVQ